MYYNQTIVRMLMEERRREAESALLVSALRVRRPRADSPALPVRDLVGSLFANRRNEAPCAC
jgi:hypothetical protein